MLCILPSTCVKTWLCIGFSQTLKPEEVPKYFMDSSSKFLIANSREGE
jgi:hypothetical protein